MKKLSVFLIMAGGLIYCSIGRANITNVYFQDDGDGAISCPLYTWNGSATAVTAPVDGIENRAGAAQILGNITLDSATDPALTLNSAINNNTGFEWTAYNVNVYMSSSFTLTGVNVTIPDGWSVNVVQPSPFASDYGTYKGQLQFTGGTPVALGNGLSFTYTLNFSGYESFSFCQEMTPVPEPGAFSFLAMGSLLLGGFLVAGRRKSHS